MNDFISFLIVIFPLLLIFYGIVLIFKKESKKRAGKILLILGIILLITYIAGGIYLFNQLVPHNECD
jgi:uncharacterized membrane protein HdeD (DUF308 family)